MLFSCQLTFWNGPFDDGEVGRKAFLSDGTVRVDCQCQNACVGDDPAWGVLPTVPPNVWTDWGQKAAREKSKKLLLKVNSIAMSHMGLTTKPPMEVQKLVLSVRYYPTP